MVSWLLCNYNALARQYRIVCSGSRELPNHHTVNIVAVSVLIWPGWKVCGCDVRVKLREANSVQIEHIVRVIGELVGLVPEVVTPFR